MGKVDDNKKIKKESLLNSALELFTTKGISDTSVSDIAKRSGVAKGTFYLYFKDKVDIRDLLIARESGKLFVAAFDAMEKEGVSDDVEEQLVFIINNIIDQMVKNTILLRFISKNLSWGVFRNLMIESYSPDDPYQAKINDLLFRKVSKEYENAEIMLYMIIELASSTCYGAILHQTPVSLAELKPYLFQAIRDIIRAHRRQDA